MESMTFEDFLEWTTGQLQHYLMRRGKATSGNKKDLAARALVSFESNDKVLDCPKDITDRLEKEYGNLLFKLNIEDPNKVDDSLWSQDLTTWPNVNLGHIFHFILTTKAFDTSYIGQYKVKKAYSYFASSRIHQVLTYNPTTLTNHVIIKSSVTPSMKVSDKPWKLWILCSKSTGVIISAYCQCTAGMSNCCNHVIAVLYKVQFANDKGYTSPTCTEVPCAFNDRRHKKIVPMKVKNMDFTKHDVLRPSPSHSILSPDKENYDPRIPKLQQQSTQVKTSFFSKVDEIVPEAVVLLTVPPTENSDCPPPVPEIAESAKMECADITDEANLLCTFMDRLTFSSRQLDELEKATKGQSTNRMWKKQRTGRITASNFHEVHTKVKSIIASKGSIKPQTTPLLVKLTQLDSSELDQIDAIKWGRENEKKAREDFFKSVGVQHKQPKLSMCGLRAIDCAPFLAASSDNIFSCTCCGKFCVELKCPYSARHCSIHEGWDKVDYLHKVDGKLKLKTTHKYYTQIQGQMKANKIYKSFFVVWTPVGLPFIDIVDFDEAHWDGVYRSLLLFFKLYLAKVLLGIRVLRFCPYCEKHILEMNEIPSRKALQENGIHCSSCHHWYHWSCVGVTALSDGCWSCPTCCDGDV